MTHFAKIPAYLDHLVVGSIASACAACGFERSLHYSWLLRSKRGDPPLQEIEWQGTVAPFHVHALEHVPVLAIAAIESAALDRAQNGVWIPSQHQGRPTWEEDEEIVKMLGTDPDPDEIELLFGQRDIHKRDVSGNRIQCRSYLKPDTGLVQLMLSAWRRKRYGAHVQVESKSEVVMRLERPEERPMKTINATPVSFDPDEDQAKQQTAKLALGRPATSTEEFDKWAAAGEFAAAPVGFTDAAGNRTERTAAADPLTVKDTDPAGVAKLKIGAQRKMAEPADTPAANPARPGGTPPRAESDEIDHLKRDLARSRGYSVSQ